VGRGK
jgi:hypothetical protein